MYKYLSKLSVFLIAVTVSPVFLLPNKAEAKCLNYWIHPTTGKQECLGISSGYSRSTQHRYDDVEVIDDDGNGEKKFRIQPTRCGGYRVRLVDKEETKSRRLNTYWLGNRSNLPILNSQRVLNPQRKNFYPGYGNRKNRKPRYDNHSSIQIKIQSGQSKFHVNYPRSEVTKFRSCQHYYQPHDNLNE